MQCMRFYSALIVNKRITIYTYNDISIYIHTNRIYNLDLQIFRKIDEFVRRKEASILITLLPIRFSNQILRAPKRRVLARSLSKSTCSHIRALVNIRSQWKVNLYHKTRNYSWESIALIHLVYYLQWSQPMTSSGWSNPACSVRSSR